MSGSTRTSVFQDWDLLQERLIPGLLELAPDRPPEAWTIGSAEDAVALSVAYFQAAMSCDMPALRVFLSDAVARPGPVQFHLSDIRCVPDPGRLAALRREARCWVPVPTVTERIILAEPTGPVDLVIPATVSAMGTSVLGRLRTGGHVLFPATPPADLLADAGYRPVGAGGRLLQKTGPSEDPPAGAAVVSWDTLAAKEYRDGLVTTHCTLARSLARRFSHHGEQRDDLEQVAVLALVKAATRYSPDHGASFATYATASILGELKRHFRDKTWMLRVPRSMQETYLAVKAAREELGQRLASSPTVTQIAEHLRISDEQVLSAMEAADSYWPASLAGPGRGEDDEPTEVPVVDEEFDRSLDRLLLLESLPRLERRQQLIVRRLYFDGWTQRRVAAEVGVSQMQVSRLMARTLETLREAFGTGTGGNESRQG